MIKKKKSAIDNKKINAKADSIRLKARVKIEKTIEMSESQMVVFENFRNKYEMSEFCDKQLAIHLRSLTDLKIKLAELEKEFSKLGPRLSL